nr:hypothetical protein [Tanacetum cinerariifolium]
ELPFELHMPALEDITTFNFLNDHEDEDFVVYQIDVKSAFLYEKIEEDVYVCQPLGFEDLNFPDRVYKVEKVLYGLHQAPRACQDKYVGEILKKFEFIKVKNASAPMETQKPLLKDGDSEEVDVHMYRSMIGSLMYLISLRPDIMFAVCACARYQVNPKVSHLQAVKRIFRYLKGHLKLGLWYPKDFPFDLVAYTDSDYTRASLDRKSTIGGRQYLRCRLISWQCKNRQWLQIQQQKLTMWLLQVVVDKCFGFKMNYFIMVNPTIYDSCIEQFWSTAMAKTINGEAQIHAQVDGKEIIITKSYVRRHIRLADEERVDCLPNSTIFENIELMGVHYVSMQNTVYYLLVEKMYPLTNHTLHQMFNNVKLQVDEECEMAYALLRYVKKQLKEGYRAN